MTEKQEAVLDFIREVQTARGIPPSVREIQRHFGFASTNAVFGHMRALAARGRIEQLDGRTWGLRVKEIQGHLAEVNVYGSIPAGLPAMQEQQPEEKIAIDPATFGVRPRQPHQFWGLRVSGDSMTGAGILDGDIVLMERREPRVGDIIAALVDETSTTLKRFLKVRGKPVLRAENRRYRDIIPTQSLEAQGVLVGVLRRAI